MQAAYQPSPNSYARRKVAYLLTPPLVAFVLAALAMALIVGRYERQHQDAIFTGVFVSGVDLSQKPLGEAAGEILEAVAFTQEPVIVLHDPTANRSWQFSPADFGFSVDIEQTVDNAYKVGRTGGPIKRLQEMFQAWYYGRSLMPVMVLDETKLNATAAQLAAEINKTAVNATLEDNGTTMTYTPGQDGRTLDTTDLKTRLIPAITKFQPVEMELLVHTTPPIVRDNPEIGAKIQRVLNTPVVFYLQEPLDDLDLFSVEVPRDELARWLRFELKEQPDGTMTHEIVVDRNAARLWLSQFDAKIYREPVKARFYFDDLSRELVLVSPHVNGRALDIDATLQNLLNQIGTPNQKIPFVIQDLVPTVNANATAEELGITELVSEKTTWFYGSSDARKHNIARAAANFYGIVVAPGEEFSFNKYLGSISEADGYEEGLIIVGGQTIKGVGGGVCQVSTTIYQTAFFAGYPIVARQEHGYWLDYYNDGEGPGMDATVFSPIVDFRFVNNTPYHLLIENYYNQELEALTFKFYSTSMGWTVEKGETQILNETEVPGPEEDRWEFDPDLPPGTVEQIDFATQGADVIVQRIVRDANGNELINEFFTSHYIPYPNTFHYGPGVEPYDYSLVPESKP